VAFLRLGMTSFGGPVAHLAYFRRTLVQERQWVTEAEYARIVAFCSVLPGPTSSQTAMLLGMLRAGPLGGFAAWLGFTLPSALIMASIAAALAAAGNAYDRPDARPAGLSAAAFSGLLVGLGAAAVAVVAQAVVGLARSLCRDVPTRLIAVGALGLALALRTQPTLQWLPIAAGGAVGLLVLHRIAGATEGLPLRVPRAVAIGSGAIFVVLAALAIVPRPPATDLIGTILRAGTFVFGGGHVVLPLLRSAVTDGLIGEKAFFAGYGAVQAMPGPLSSFASYLGWWNSSPLRGPAGAAVATVLFFLPSFALVFALAPVWNRIAVLPRAGGAVAGANAAVVGLLVAVIVESVAFGPVGRSAPAILIALAAFVVIAASRVPPWIVVVAAAALGAAVHA